MHGRSVHIATALLVMMLTVLTPDGALLSLVGPDPIGVQADAAGVPSTDLGYVMPVQGAAEAAVQGTTSQGTVSVTVTVIDPVIVTPPRYVSIYRFYSQKTGTHFFTSSAIERDIVLWKWPDIWSYEGVAYQLNEVTNAQPLYRFWNRFNGAHFYTASETERNIVIARWSNVFIFEGANYNVSLAPSPGSPMVYRFYNLKNGSHFYTASTVERDIVLAKWPHIYQYEGGSFWLGQ